MVGGGCDGFIGVVYCYVMVLDYCYEFVVGVFFFMFDKVCVLGWDLGLVDGCNYGSWQELLVDELKCLFEECIDLVSIVMFNYVYYEVVYVFVDVGFYVVCDKLLVYISVQVQSFVDLVVECGIVFGVIYNYFGYLLVCQVCEMVVVGVFGLLCKVIVEYNQGWFVMVLDNK